MRWHNLIIAAIMLSLVGAGHARSENFPRRISATPATTNSVPHVQIGITPDPAISAALLSRADEIPGVEIRETVISMPGAKGFWRDDSVVVARPQNIVGGREFAHMHPDGSLHASLSPEHALEAVKLGWATYHPWSTERPGWEGFVMIYTPTSQGELEVVLRLVRRAYGFVTGAD